MKLAFTDEQRELREMARAFLAEHSGSEQVRAAMASDAGFDPAVWKQIGSELGWCAVDVPEEHGGLGLGFVELAALLEVTGEALLCAPFFSTVALGGTALRIAGNDAQQREQLPALAEGRRLVTLAVPGPSGAAPGGAWDAAGVTAIWRRTDSGYSLSGESRYVPDAHVADQLVVAARAEGSSGDHGVSLFLVPADAEGLRITPLPTMDTTRRLASVVFENAPIQEAGRMGPEGDAAPLLRRILDLAAIALAAESVGVAQRALDDSVAYAKERVQFGRPIGGFQAIKHACADMMVRVESARSAVYYAACVAASEDTLTLPRAASLAKATASEAAFHCAAESLQIHGGVGFTWEYDVHLLLKRARASESMLGDPSWHRERVATLLLDGDGA